jgi:hypothetical protein
MKRPFHRDVLRGRKTEHWGNFWTELAKSDVKTLFQPALIRPRGKKLAKIPFAPT